jgi:hypothetical protein
MSNEHYKKYKRNIKQYMNEVGIKGSSWRYYEELENTYPDIIKDYAYIVPDSLLEYGNGKKVKSWLKLD